MTASGPTDPALTARSATYQAMAGNVAPLRVIRRNVLANLVCRQRAAVATVAPTSGQHISNPVFPSSGEAIAAARDFANGGVL